MKNKEIVVSISVFTIILVFAVLSWIPKSEPQLVEAVVTSKGIRPAVGPSGDRLAVRTDTGRIAIVSTSSQFGIRVGDRILLSTHDRYLFGPKYQFVKKSETEY